MCYTLPGDERGLREGTTGDWQERIAIDPDILAGKPIIRGTHLAVGFTNDLLAQGWTKAEALRNYPGLTHKDV